MYVQSANRKILISWDLSAGADSYLVQRSLDNVTFSALATISGSPLATEYLDTSATIGTQYWYRVAAQSGSDVSSYTTAQSNIAVPTAERTLSQIRDAAKQRADRVNSNFVTKPEWNQYINMAMFELYDLLITVYEDLYVATPVQFTADGTTFLYPLPDGATTFNSGITPSTTIVAKPFYKLIGVDLALNNATNAYVTLDKFMFEDRNTFVYPNTASTIYGVFNMRYRLLGLDKIEFIPTPSAGQAIRLWYIPRLTELLSDTDTTDTSISGWIEYVIVKAAYYALTKEESDTQSLVLQLAALQERIQTTAVNRDAGKPERISDSRARSGFNGTGYGGPNGRGGF
jgi:hypothetical protein